jgi:hypothetical protein
MVTMARSLMRGRWGKRNVASLPSAEADGQGGMSFARAKQENRRAQHSVRRSPMEGLLLGAGGVAVLVGLGALSAGE